MLTGSSETLIGWKSGKTTYVPSWAQMEGVAEIAMDIGQELHLHLLYTDRHHAHLRKVNVCHLV